MQTSFDIRPPAPQPIFVVNDNTDKKVEVKLAPDLLPFFGNLNLHLHEGFREGCSKKIIVHFSETTLKTVIHCLELLKIGKDVSDYLTPEISTFENCIHLFDCLHYFSIKTIQNVFFQIVRTPPFLDDLHQKFIDRCSQRQPFSTVVTQLYLDLAFYKAYFANDYHEACKAITYFAEGSGWPNLMFWLNSTPIQPEVFPFLIEVLLLCKGDQEDVDGNIATAIGVLENNFAKLFEGEDDIVPLLPSDSPKKFRGEESQKKSSFYLPYFFCLFRTALAVSNKDLALKLLKIPLYPGIEEKSFTKITSSEQEEYLSNEIYCTKYFKHKESIVATLLLQLFLENFPGSDHEEFIEHWKQVIREIEISKEDLKRDAYIPLTILDEKLQELLNSLKSQPVPVLPPGSFSDSESGEEIDEDSQNSEMVSEGVHKALELKKTNLFECVEFCLSFELKKVYELLELIIDLDNPDEVLNILTRVGTCKDPDKALLRYLFYVRLVTYQFVIKQDKVFVYDILRTHIFPLTLSFCQASGEFQEQFFETISKNTSLHHILTLILKERDDAGISLIYSYRELLIESSKTPFISEIEARNLHSGSLDFAEIVLAVCLLNEDYQSMVKLLNDKNGQSERSLDESLNASYERTGSPLEHVIPFLSSTRSYSKDFLDNLYALITENMHLYGKKTIVSWLIKVFLKQGDEFKTNIEALIALEASPAETLYYELLCAVQRAEFTTLNAKRFSLLPDHLNKEMDQALKYGDPSDSDPEELNGYKKIYHLGKVLAKFSAQHFSQISNFFTDVQSARAITSGYIKRVSKREELVKLSIRTSLGIALLHACELAKIPSKHQFIMETDDMEDEEIEKAS